MSPLLTTCIGFNVQNYVETAGVKPKTSVYELSLWLSFIFCNSNASSLFTSKSNGYKTAGLSRSNDAGKQQYSASHQRICSN
jgi:hypothetical protein